MTDLLENLNQQQKQAVLINRGSLLVFAGAGSGKTRVITTKIAYAIENNLAFPSQILAVTFTNKACREMAERVASLIGEEKASKICIKTFHSFGVWLLRRFGEKVGLTKDFTIYDDKDSAALLAQCFPNDPKKEIDQAAKQIATLKDRMKTPPAYDDRLCHYYEAYNAKLAATGNVDFADMILKSIQLLRNFPDVAEYVHNRFKMILVDEYQDSNTAQFMLLQLLKGEDTFLCVVGDDDQSIYRFRGAQVENILNFPKIFKDTQTVVLGRNYRCTEPILSVARDVILHNKGRAQKELVAENTSGVKPKLYFVNSEFDEAQQVINILKELPSSARESAAVLYRTNAQSKTFEDRLMMNNIPYHIVGSLKFYDREEIRDAIALVGLVANPNDSVAFERMVNKPPRGIGDVTMTNLLSAADHNLMNQGNVIEASENAIEEGSVKGKAVEGLKNFLGAYKKAVSDIGKLTNSELLTNILKDFGVMEYYLNRDKEEHNTDSSRVDNLNQLVSMLTAQAFSDGIEGIHAFLEYVALDPSSLGKDEGENNGGVTLITMHNTKGLEFDRVFVTGMEDEIFPSLRDGENQQDLEEERRICYVAFTRARKELYIFCSKSRMIWGRTQLETPSRFISEIDPSHIQKIDLRTEEPKFGFRSYGYDFYQNSYGKKNYIKPKYDVYDSYEPPKSRVVVVKKADKKPVGSPDIKFEVGERVRNELLGDGTITAIKEWAGKETVVVTFDSGKMGTYLKSRFDFTKSH